MTTDKITILPADRIPTGRYARMLHKHLQENFPEELEQMTQNQTLTAYLQKAQDQTTHLVQTRIQELVTVAKKKKGNPEPGFLQNTSHYEHARITAEEEILPVMFVTGFLSRSA